MHPSHLFHLLRQCTALQSPFEGRKLHAHMLKTGIHSYLPSFCNVLVDLYGKCGHLRDALKLFVEMPLRNVISWASILTAYNQANLPQGAISVFSNVFCLDRLEPDHFVFASLVNSCASLSEVKLGRQVHARFIRSLFSQDDVVKSSLVDMYAKCGLPDKASLVFSTIGLKNKVSWTALISGYARSGRKLEAIEMFRQLEVKNLHSWTALVSGLVQTGNHADAFELFAEMRRERIEIADPFILSSITGAAASLASLELGKQVHGLILALGYGSNLFVTNAFIDMYAKVSDLSAAKKIFDGMLKRDVVTWTSIIVGMAQHGRSNEAFSYYDGMIMAGVTPNDVTFMGLLYACSHVGMVEKGRDLFKSMVKDYGLKPGLRHYTCLLDMYSRSGHLEEAEDILNTMPFHPDEAAWSALLSACKLHGNTESEIRIADRLLTLGPEDPSTLVLLENAYARACIWENVSKVRKMMADMEMKREPGYSCINLAKASSQLH